MTTREQLEAEARELYPVLNWDAYHQEPVETYGYEECQQEAHVRAKTISAEQVEAAMKAYHEGWRVEGDGRRLHQSAIECAFRAAGFLIEGDDDAT